MMSFGSSSRPPSGRAARLVVRSAAPVLLLAALTAAAPGDAPADPAGAGSGSTTNGDDLTGDAAAAPSGDDGVGGIEHGVSGNRISLPDSRGIRGHQGGDPKPTDPVAPSAPGRAGWHDFGGGIPGKEGTPTATATGTVGPGGTIEIVVAGAPPHSTAFIVLGASKADLPVAGGVLVPSPDLVVTAQTDAKGQLHVTVALPEELGLPSGPGEALLVQVWFVEQAEDGTMSITASNALGLGAW